MHTDRLWRCAPRYSKGRCQRYLNPKPSTLKPEQVFEGQIPALPPNTKEQFDEWSKVWPMNLYCNML